MTKKILITLLFITTSALAGGGGAGSTDQYFIRSCKAQVGNGPVVQMEQYEEVVDNFSNGFPFSMVSDKTDNYFVHTSDNLLFPSSLNSEVEYLGAVISVHGSSGPAKHEYEGILVIRKTSKDSFVVRLKQELSTQPDQRFDEVIKLTSCTSAPKYDQ